MGKFGKKFLVLMFTLLCIVPLALAGCDLSNKDDDAISLGKFYFAYHGFYSEYSEECEKINYDSEYLNFSKNGLVNACLVISDPNNKLLASGKWEIGEYVFSADETQINCDLRIILSDDEVGEVIRYGNVISENKVMIFSYIDDKIICSVFIRSVLPRSEILYGIEYEEGYSETRIFGVGRTADTVKDSLDISSELKNIIPSEKIRENECLGYYFILDDFENLEKVLDNYASQYEEKSSWVNMSNYLEIDSKYKVYFNSSDDVRDVVITIETYTSKWSKGIIINVFSFEAGFITETLAQM